MSTKVDEIIPGIVPAAAPASLRYDEVVRGENKGKLPFKGSEWRPFPRAIARKYGILKMKLEVSDFGGIVTPKGLVTAHPAVVNKWIIASGLSSLRVYTDFNSEVSVHSKKDGPALRLKNGSEISMKKIIAEAFVPNPMGKPCVAVLNNDPLDLRASNLMWMTRSEIYRFTTDGVLPQAPLEKKDLTYGLPYGGRFDFASRILRIGVSLSEFNGVRDTLAAHGYSTIATDAANMYFFIRFWNNFGIRDFGYEDMPVYFGISGNTVQNAVKALIQSDLIIYDNTLWKKRQGAYEYTALECERIDVSGSIELTYSCRGTRVDEMLVLYIKSLRSDVYTPEWKDEWEGLKLKYEHPSYYYESNYGVLTYRYTSDPDNMLERIRESHFVANCVANLRKPFSYTESSGRAYPAFARSKREYRHGFEYEGSPLTEFVDIHCSFYTLLVKLLKDTVPEDERVRFFDECLSGRLYDSCAEFINEKKRKKVSRDEVKEMMQAWRNDIDGDKSLKKVQEFMEKNYPNVKRVIDEWPTYKDKVGKIHKLLQRDCGTIETKLMSKLAFEIEGKYNVKCFLLHDAIYVSEKELKEKLPENIHDLINKWLRDNILH